MGFVCDISDRFAECVVDQGGRRVQSYPKDACPEVQQTNPEEAISGVQGQSHPTALQHGDLMA